MTHDAALWAYCRLVGSALRLQRRRKKELLAGLRQELEERFRGMGALTLKQISAEVGPYDKVADELMEGVPEGERQQYMTHQRWLSWYLIALLLIILAVVVAYIVFPPRSQMLYWRQDAAYVSDEIAGQQEP